MFRSCSQGGGVQKVRETISGINPCCFVGKLHWLSAEEIWRDEGLGSGCWEGCIFM